MPRIPQIVPEHRRICVNEAKPTIRRSSIGVVRGWGGVECLVYVRTLESYGDEKMCTLQMAGERERQRKGRVEGKGLGS